MNPTTGLWTFSAAAAVFGVLAIVSGFIAAQFKEKVETARDSAFQKKLDDNEKADAARHKVLQETLKQLITANAKLNSEDRVRIVQSITFVEAPKSSELERRYNLGYAMLWILLHFPSGCLQQSSILIQQSSRLTI